MIYCPIYQVIELCKICAAAACGADLTPPAPDTIGGAKNLEDVKRKSSLIFISDCCLSALAVNNVVDYPRRDSVNLDERWKCFHTSVDSSRVFYHTPWRLSSVFEKKIILRANEARAGGRAPINRFGAARLRALAVWCGFSRSPRTPLRLQNGKRFVWSRVNGVCPRRSSPNARSNKTRHFV